MQAWYSRFEPDLGAKDCGSQVRMLESDGLSQMVLAHGMCALPFVCLSFYAV